MIADEHLYLRLRDVPDELCDQRRFLAWERRGRKKVPLDRRGHPCNADDPTHWQSLWEASQQSYYASEGPRGVGFALCDSGLAVIDLDHCIDTESGAIRDDAQRWIDLFPSASELSPSGSGVHVFVRAALPEGNRPFSGGDLLGRGHVTITGHRLDRGPIRDGGDEWEEFLRSLGPPRGAVGHIERLRSPSRADVDAVIARAWPNRRFRTLWHGDPSEYPTRSEADAALAMHAARNGADLSLIVAVMKASALPRDASRDQRYFESTAAFALATAKPAVGRWTGITVPANGDAERDAIARLQRVGGSDAVLLQRLAQEIARQRVRGQERDGGWFRVSPQNMAGDFAPRAGFRAPEKIMSRDSCLRALKRLAAAGVFDLRTGEDEIIWHPGGQRRTRQGRVTLVRVAGTDVASILNGFSDRLARALPEASAPPVYVIARGRIAEAGEAA